MSPPRTPPKSLGSSLGSLQRSGTLRGGNGRGGGFHTPVRGTMFVCNGAVTPGPSRECDITFFVKGRPKCARQSLDSRVQSVTVPSSRVSNECRSPGLRFPPLKNARKESLESVERVFSDCSWDLSSLFPLNYEGGTQKELGQTVFADCCQLGSGTTPGRRIFIHHQCWEVLPFCRFQHLPALVVYKNPSPNPNTQDNSLRKQFAQALSACSCVI